MDTKQILIQAGNHVAEVLSKIDPAQIDACLLYTSIFAKPKRIAYSGFVIKSQIRKQTMHDAKEQSKTKRNIIF